MVDLFLVGESSFEPPSATTPGRWPYILLQSKTKIRLFLEMQISRYIGDMEKYKIKFYSFFSRILNDGQNFLKIRSSDSSKKLIRNIWNFFNANFEGGKSGDFWFSLKFENPWSPSKLVKEIPLVLPSTPTVYDQRGLWARKTISKRKLFENFNE